MLMLEVLLARMASGRQMPSSLRIMSCLTSRFSAMLSTTRSAGATSSSLVVMVIRSRVAWRSASDSFPFFTREARMSTI